VARVRLGSGTAGARPGAEAARGAVGGGGGTRRNTWKRCERKKGRGRVYSLMFVRSTHQSTNISGLAYVAPMNIRSYIRRFKN
jgi:hypothetical protein